jgi:hypothetical protein
MNTATLQSLETALKSAKSELRRGKKKREEVDKALAVLAELGRSPSKADLILRCTILVGPLFFPALPPICTHTHAVATRINLPYCTAAHLPVVHTHHSGCWGV